MSSLSSLLADLRSIRHPALLGLAVFGSIGRRIVEGKSSLRGCKDLDLLLIVTNVKQFPVACLSGRRTLQRVPKDVFLVSYADFEDRLGSADIQLISILREAFLVFGTLGVRQWKARVDSTTSRSEVADIQRLLDFGSGVACERADVPRRSSVAALAASTQAVLLSLGLQPLGGDFEPGLLRALSRKRLAPSGYANVRIELRKRRVSPWGCAARRHLSRWVSSCAAHAVRNLATSHWRSSGHRPKPPAAVLLDVGGTLLMGDGALRPDTATALRSLRKRFRVVAVSNATLELRARLRAMSIGDCFDEIVCSSEVGSFKPEPQIFRYALDRLGLAAEEALMIGDNLHADVIGAWNCGIPAIWLFKGASRRTWMRAWGGVSGDLLSLADYLVRGEWAFGPGSEGARRRTARMMAVAN
jgi:HAD superfamily hydrolase (TIGR01509 family)